MSKFKMNQLTLNQEKTKRLINLKISSYSRDNHGYGNTEHNKSSNVFYLKKELKQNSNLFEARPLSNNSNNVMNIVNNLNTTDGINQVGSNKNVEINFNKYEIKILSDKPASDNTFNVKMKLPHQHGLNEPKEGNEIMITNSCGDTASKLISKKQEENKAENEQIVIKEEKAASKSHKTSMVLKKSFTDNKSNDPLSSNIICTKKSVKETKILKLISSKGCIPKNNYKDIKSVNPQKEPQKETNEKVIDKIPKEHPAKENNNTIEYPFLRNVQMISKHNEIILYGKEKTFEKNSLVFNKPIIKIINDRNSGEDSQDNSMSELILDGRQHSNFMLKLQKPINTIESDSKNENIFFERKGFKKLSIIPKSKHSDSNKGNYENNLLSSSDSSIATNKDDSKEKSIDTISNFISFRHKSVVVDNINPDDTSIHISNNLSHQGSPKLFKSKENISGYSFLLKRAASVLVPSKEKKKKKKRKTIKKLETMNLYKLQRHLQPKKNKRFIKQLSKISENAHRISVNTYKPKLGKSSSLPSAPKNKMIFDHELSFSFVRQSSYLTPRKKISKLLNHQESVKLLKRGSIIREVDQSSVSESSKRNSSSVEEKSSFRILKKASLMSNTTNSINYVDLKSNSIKIGNDISKCLTLAERSFCQPFIDKQLGDIQLDQIDIEGNATEEKNDMLSKAILFIDIKYEKIQEKRRNTITSYANDTLSQINSKMKIKYEDFVPDIHVYLEEKANYESDIMNEYSLYESIFHKFVFPYPKLLFSPLTEKYYEIDLPCLIYKAQYLNIATNNIVRVSSISSNINKKTLKTQRTSIKTKFRPAQKISFKLSKLNTLSGINGSFCFRFIKDDDIQFDNQQSDKVINFRTQSFPTQKLSFPNRRSKQRESSKNNNLFKNKKKSTLFKKNITQMSFMTKKTFEEFGTALVHYKKRDSILGKNFYSRNRDTIGNIHLNEGMNESYINHKISLSRRKEELFMSPLKHFEVQRNLIRRPTLITNKLLIFNKETVLSQTHEIKSKILTEMKNHTDSLFFYIKDGNFQNFSDIFLKYKIDPEIKDTKGNTFLNMAVQCDRLRITNFLIDSGADVNTQNIRLNTPLHYALCFKNFYLADILIRSGSDEMIMNKNGLTPWQCINSSSANL